MNLIRSEGFNPLIFEATRITENLASHIHSNFVYSSTCGSIAYEISDHLPVFTVTCNLNHSPFPDTMDFRNCKKLMKRLFLWDLNYYERKINWSPVFKGTETNESLSRFLHTLNGISNEHAPFLRTVPTIVTAHTFCASPDTRISYRQCLLIQGYFCAV